MGAIVGWAVFFYFLWVIGPVGRRILWVVGFAISLVIAIFLARIGAFKVLFDALWRMTMAILALAWMVVKVAFG